MHCLVLSVSYRIQECFLQNIVVFPTGYRNVSYRIQECLLQDIGMFSSLNYRLSEENIPLIGCCLQSSSPSASYSRASITRLIATLASAHRSRCSSVQAYLNSCVVRNIVLKIRIVFDDITYMNTMVDSFHRFYDVHSDLMQL